ncbi:hypothetical protein [Benzoatithermus flavus]|uniref:Uncharacterized protein n=1 Tax=Benzoatithermus flavus TaxID=3108223 RepID=A0ABU8XTJ0_9PROT
MKVSLRAILVTLLALGPISPAMLRAQADWQEDLAGEIGLTRNCTVAFLSHVVERTVDGRQLVMAKVHCDDERVFDALRPDVGEPFRFSECQPDATQGC